MPDPDAFLLKDYELKIAYLTNHFTRLWTRFNYFVSLQTALFTGKILLPTSEPPWAFPLMGLGLSLGWYIVGAEDRYLVRIYRQHINEAAKRLEGRLLAEAPSFGALTPVGEIRNSAAALEALDKARPASLDKLADKITGWRREPISTTRMAAWIPLLLALIWAVLLVRELLG
jgi:hypothetical protein